MGTFWNLPSGELMEYEQINICFAQNIPGKSSTTAEMRHPWRRWCLRWPPGWAVSQGLRSHAPGEVGIFGGKHFEPRFFVTGIFLNHFCWEHDWIYHFYKHFVWETSNKMKKTAGTMHVDHAFNHSWQLRLYEPHSHHVFMKHVAVCCRFKLGWTKLLRCLQEWEGTDFFLIASFAGGIFAENQSQLWGLNRIEAEGGCFTNKGKRQTHPSVSWPNPTNPCLLSSTTLGLVISYIHQHPKLLFHISNSFAWKVSIWVEVSIPWGVLVSA